MLPFDHWSYSKLSTYQRCPAQFFFRYIENAPAEELGVALPLGTAVHNAVTLYHVQRSQRVDVQEDQILKSFRDQLTGSVQHPEAPVVFTESCPDLESLLNLGESLVRAYLAQPHSGSLVAVEQELRGPICLAGDVVSDLPLLGIVDRIEQGPDQAVTAVELKTAARAWSEAEGRLSDQATVYALLLRSAGRSVSRVRFEILTKTKVPRLQILDSERTNDDIDRLVVKILHVERAVRAGSFPRNQDPSNCHGCPYKGRCRSSMDL